MDGIYQVPVDELIGISKKLVTSYFPSPDIYSLLLLALITVTVYSQKIHHLNPYSRIQLAVAVLPELINALLEDGTIAKKEAFELTNQCKQKSNDLVLIMQTYMYAAEGLHIKIKSEKKKQCSTQ